MELIINYAAVFTSGIASMVIGFLWYGPLFGTTWMKLTGMSETDRQAAQSKGMGKNYALMFLSSLTMAFVLAHIIGVFTWAFGIGPMHAALAGGIWSWLGFIATTSLSGVLWDKKPWKLWILNNGYELVRLLAMSLIISFWK